MAVGFFCSLEILYGGLGIGTLFGIFFSKYFQVFGHQNPGPDPDPYQVNMDPKHLPVRKEDAVPVQ
jgi:hypothetical protein